MIRSVRSPYGTVYERTGAVTPTCERSPRMARANPTRARSGVPQNEPKDPDRMRAGAMVPEIARTKPAASSPPAAQNEPKDPRGAPVGSARTNPTSPRAAMARNEPENRRGRAGGSPAGHSALERLTRGRHMHAAAGHAPLEVLGLAREQAEGAPVDRHDQVEVQELVAGDGGGFRAHGE